MKYIPLKHVATLNDEVLPESFPPNAPIKYAEVSDVSQGRPIQWKEPMPFVQTPSRARRIVEHGDMLISTVRTYLRAVTQVEHPPTGAIVSTGFAVVRPRTADSKYLGYVLQSNAFIDKVVSQSVGVSYPAISSREIARIKISCPEIENQRRIADFLDRETAEIDAFIADQERLIELLEERRAATITHAVTKGLDPNVPMKDSGIEWVGSIPEHWVINRFSRCVRINSGQVDPEHSDFSDLPLIAPNHVESGTGKLIELETAATQGAHSGKYFVQAGQVIYSKIRPNLMKTVIAPSDCLCSADMYGLEADSNQLRNKFLMYLLLSRPFHDYAVDQSMRVAMPKLNQDTLGAAPIWLPPLVEQKHIVSFLETELAVIDTTTEDAREAIVLSRERRAALISAAVTGQIDVSQERRPAVEVPDVEGVWV